VAAGAASPQKPLTLDHLLALKQLGYSEEQIRAEVERTGAQFHLSAEDERKLKAAGFSDAMLAFLKKTERENLPDEAFKLPPLPPGLELPVGPRPPLAVLTRPAEPGSYAHPGKRFLLRYPSAWQLIRYIENDHVFYCLTPQAGVANPHELKVMLQVALVPSGVARTVRAQPPARVLERVLPSIAREEPGMRRVGKIEPAPVGNLAGARIVLRGGLRHRQGEFISTVFAAADEGVVFLVAAVAPSDQQGLYRPMFESILQRSRFGRVRPERRKQDLTARSVCEQYEASVVRIEASSPDEGSTGTGFFVTKSGYVLTNAHVVLNSRYAPHKEFRLLWDQRLGRPAVNATLVGYSVGSLVYTAGGETDVALLKADAGEYVPMPLNSVSDVRLGDPVLTLGFPSGTKLAGVSTTATGGMVTRFNVRPDGEAVSFYTDAPSTHGSSGGPCVSLVTGGVIGQTSFGTDVQLDAKRKDLNDLINYYGVLAADVCLREFPLVAAMGIDPTGDRLDFIDCCDLSLFIATRVIQRGVSKLGIACSDALNQARSLAYRASKLRPDQPHGHYLAALCLRALSSEPSEGDSAVVALLVAGQKKAACDLCLRALSHDPVHRESLLTLALMKAETQEWRAAEACADRAVRAWPGCWDAHYVRAQIANLQGRRDEALRFAENAQAAVGGLLAEPHLLAGRLYYDKGDYEAGRKAFQEAVQLDPKCLEARLGVAEYYERTQQNDRAVAEYQRIVDGFPQEPTPFTRLGNCLFRAKEYEKASKQYAAALHWAKATYAPPPRDALLNLARCGEELKLMDGAILQYASYLEHYGKEPEADVAHIRLANLHAARNRLGLASSHLRRARELRDSEDLRTVLAHFHLRQLTFDEVCFIAKHYAIPVAADLILCSPLDFSVNSAEDAKEMMEKHKIPQPLVRAIVLSQEKNKPRRPDPPRRPAPPDPEHPQPPHPQPPPQEDVKPPKKPCPLVGVWRGTSPGHGMGDTRVVQITFQDNGRFAFQSWVRNVPLATNSGTYEYTGTAVRGRTDTGLTYEHACRLQGATLILNLPDYGGETQFTRQNATPTP